MYCERLQIYINLSSLLSVILQIILRIPQNFTFIIVNGMKELGQETLRFKDDVTMKYTSFCLNVQNLQILTLGLESSVHIH